ncbi:alpha/beta hydrolase [Alphaproteobacteria bacterium]|jgi:haloacetate dehalogenase|nr:alpha/beta hydrolase [Alphaproteobacteria bacterium]MDB9869522.1 alpha/beta hydrolase [Alphaproteobacteria bacterium]MDC1209364.1 alpha/beta hydrolase [Pseudomonadota bacterium]|tara:strand:- start:3082 stop:3960 length:879 start_codon:yes stop_codon:yes gene_type:complete
MNFFSDFELSSINTKRGVIRYRKAGQGPVLLMLHGNPQTHAMWHKVAPELVNQYTVICPDIPGYGKSFKPVISNNHSTYSKINMALDIINFMELLGFDKFQIVAHDRGARIAHRIALDFPEKVIKMILLDIIPTIEHFERTNMEFAMGYYHWFWLAQRSPIPESVINKAPEEWFFAHTSREEKDKNFFDPIALNDYLDCVKNPETIKAICEDYRAAATIDLIDDKKSRDNNIKIKAPTLVLWGNKGKLEQWYEPLSIWQNYCSSDLRGNAINSGHYLAEENPDEIIKNIKLF